MPRPPKCRRVTGRPVADYFKPAGIPVRDLELRTLALDGLEVLRLVDCEGLDQDEAARRMEVSRPTVTRILQKARKTVADMIVHGLALRIEGGYVTQHTEPKCVDPRPRRGGGPRRRAPRPAGESS